MELGTHKRDWEELAKFDAMWAVLTVGNKRGNKWDPAEFFNTGRIEIENLMAEIGGWSDKRDKALDFGCGVGRLTRALGGHYREAYGVDVSEAMVSKATLSTPGCHFRVNNADDLRLFGDEMFDLVYSNMVLQHLPSKEMISRYITEFFRVANPGGLVVFQVPSRKALKSQLQLKRSTYRLLRAVGVRSEAIMGRLRGIQPMRMTPMAERDVLATIDAAGGKLLKRRPDPSAPFGVMYCCRRLDARQKAPRKPLI